MRVLNSLDLKSVGFSRSLLVRLKKNARLSGKNYTYPVDLSDCVLQTAGVAAAQGTKHNTAVPVLEYPDRKKKQQYEKEHLKPLYDSSNPPAII